MVNIPYFRPPPDNSKYQIAAQFVFISMLKKQEILSWTVGVRGSMILNGAWDKNISRNIGPCDRTDVAYPLEA